MAITLNFKLFVDKSTWFFVNHAFNLTFSLWVLKKRSFDGCLKVVDNYLHVRASVITTQIEYFRWKKSFMLKFVIYSLRWNCLSAPLRILSSVPFSFSRVSPPHSRLQLRLLPPFGDGVRNLLNGFLMWRQNYFIPFRQYYGQPGKVSIHFFFS